MGGAVKRVVKKVTKEAKRVGNRVKQGNITGVSTKFSLNGREYDLFGGPTDVATNISQGLGEVTGANAAQDALSQQADQARALAEREAQDARDAAANARANSAAELGANIKVGGRRRKGRTGGSLASGLALGQGDTGLQL